MKSPIEIWNIDKDKALEYIKMIFDADKIKHIAYSKELKAYFYCGKEMELPTSDELIKEIIDSGYDFQIYHGHYFTFDANYIIEIIVNNIEKVFSGDTIYECLIKAVYWIREQK